MLVARPNDCWCLQEPRLTGRCGFSDGKPTSCLCHWVVCYCCCCCSFPSTLLWACFHTCIAKPYLHILCSCDFCPSLCTCCLCSVDACFLSAQAATVLALVTPHPFHPHLLTHKPLFFSTSHLSSHSFDLAIIVLMDSIYPLSWCVCIDQNTGAFAANSAGHTLVTQPIHSSRLAWLCLRGSCPWLC